jgi:acetyl-CoA acetyltransferase
MTREAPHDFATGVSCKSCSGTLMPQAPRGECLRKVKRPDLIMGGLTGVFGEVHWGASREHRSIKWGLTRGDRAAFTPDSHRRGAQAVGEGHVPTTPESASSTDDASEHPWLQPA